MKTTIHVRVYRSLVNRMYRSYQTANIIGLFDEILLTSEATCAEHSLVIKSSRKPNLITITAAKRFLYCQELW